MGKFVVRKEISVAGRVWYQRRGEMVDHRTCEQVMSGHMGDGANAEIVRNTR
jgi:hypothetical protein